MKDAVPAPLAMHWATSLMSELKRLQTDRERLEQQERACSDATRQAQFEYEWSQWEVEKINHLLDMFASQV